MATENDATNDVLKISGHRDGAVAVIALAGELDLHGAGLLDAEVRRLLGDPVDGLEIDAGDLEFVDSSGLRSIVLARAQAEAVGASFRITTVSPTVSRVIEIAGLAGYLLTSGPTGA